MKGYSRVWRDALAYAAHIPVPLEHLRSSLVGTTGILLLDATHIAVRGEERWVHIAYDTGIGVIDFWIDETENKTAYGYMLSRIAGLGYEPRCVVSDEHTGIVPLITEAGIPHQYCLFHVLQSLRRLLNNGKIRKDIPEEHRVLYARLSGILKTSSLSLVPERIRALRTIQGQFSHPVQRRAMRWFWRTMPHTLMWLSFPDVAVPRTNNLLENINGQLKQRFKTFRGVKSEESLQKTLTILFYFMHRKR